MSASSQNGAGGAPKGEASSHVKQSSQGPRVNNGPAGGNRKAQGRANKVEPKADAGRRSPQAAESGQAGKAKQSPKPKATSNISDYLRQRGATAEIAAAVTAIRADIGGYFSEELVFNTYTANNHSAEATRAALNQSKTTSWASKVSPSVATASSSAPAASEAVPAPAHIAQQQQGPRPRKVKTVQEKKPVAAEPAAPEPVVEPVVDPEQLQKSLENALQAHQTREQLLRNLQADVTRVQKTQAELTSEKQGLLEQIHAMKAKIQEHETRVVAIDVNLSTAKQEIASLNKTIAQQTAKQ